MMLSVRNTIDKVNKTIPVFLYRAFSDSGNLNIPVQIKKIKP